MAKGLLEIQEAEYRSKAALRSAEARHREQKALREAAFAKEETPYAYMNFSMGPPQPGLVQTPKNPGLMGGPQYQSSDLPSGMTPLDVQEMLDYQRQAGTQEITAVPYNVGFRPGQQPTLLNQQQMPSARSLVQSSGSGLMSGRQPTPLIDSGQGRFNNNIPNQFGRNASPPVSIPRQQPTLSGKTLQPLSDYARLEPDGSAPAPRVLGTDKDRAKAALEKYFPDDAIVQGLMANAFHESKFDSEVFETPKQSDEEKAQNSPGTFKKDQEQGYGLFQFTGEHLTDYVDWLDKTGLENSMDAQVKFVHDSIYTNASEKIKSGPNAGKYVYTGPHDIGSEARKKLLKDFYSGDPEKIAKSFATNYEKMEPAGQPAVRGTTAKKYAEEADPVFPSNQLLDYQFGQGSNLGMPTTKKTKKKIATKPLKPS